MPEIGCCDAVSMQVFVIGFSVTYVNIKEHPHHALSALDDAADWYPAGAQDGPSCPGCAAWPAGTALLPATGSCAKI